MAFEADDEEAVAWIGRVALIRRYGGAVSEVYSRRAVDHLRALDMATKLDGLNDLRTLLYQARADLQMETGQTSIVIQKGEVFDYFDELRKLIETARQEVFFVDAYLDADFVPRYLPRIAASACIRLLGGPAKMSTLLPAVDLFAAQYGREVQVRPAAESVRVEQVL